MTNLDDFDRSLADFLADGPITAPEAPVIAAMAHARTTPRRPDLLRPFRPDVMAPPRRWPLGLRPGLVLAGAALLVAMVGVAVIGSRPQDPMIVVPGPSSSPAPSGSVGPFFARIQVQVAAGNPLTLTVTDTTGALVDAVSTAPGDGASVDGGTIAVATDPTDPTVLIATWTGMPCETRAAMIVDERTSNISVSHENCSGDTVAFDRVVRLTFHEPIDVAAWHGTVIGEPQESLPAPTPSTGPAGLHVDLTGQCCGSPSIDIVDLSGHLTGAESAPSENVTTDVTTATNDDPRTVRLTWVGAPCDTVHRLTIAVDFGLTIDRPKCLGDSMATFRAVVLTFDQAVDAAAMDTAIVDGRAESGLPTWHLAAPDSAEGRYDLDVFDPGNVVARFEGYFDPGTSPDEAGPTGIRLVSRDATKLTMFWLAPPCAVTPTLAIDPSGDTWRLTEVACQASGADVLRMVDVTLATRRTPDTITIELGVEAR